MGEHDGHRKRMRERVLQGGLNSMPDHELLEVLLFYVQPRRNCNDIAHRLLDRFGSLRGVLEADPRSLQSVEGIGPQSAAFLHLLPELTRRYHRDTLHGRTKTVNNETAARALLFPVYFGLRVEKIVVLTLDSRLKLIRMNEMSEGTSFSATLDMRRIAEWVVSQNASAVILAHNHVSGPAEPSNEDLNATRQLQSMLRPLNTTLADHFIFAGDEVYSMAAHGLLSANPASDSGR